MTVFTNTPEDTHRLLFLCFLPSRLTAYPFEFPLRVISSPNYFLSAPSLAGSSSIHLGYQPSIRCPQAEQKSWLVKDLLKSNGRGGMQHKNDTYVYWNNFTKSRLKPPNSSWESRGGREFVDTSSRSSSNAGKLRTWDLADELNWNTQTYLSWGSTLLSINYYIKISYTQKAVPGGS